MGAEIVQYFDNDWRTKDFCCPKCGWTGKYDDMSQDFHREVADGSCPECYQMLLVIGYPFADEIRSAAAHGNEEAKRMLQGVEASEARRAEYEKHKLTQPAQLPDLDGDTLDFSLDFDEDKYIISLGVREVWRELAHYEDWPRFAQLKATLKTKYEDRFGSLNITDAARYNMLGDDIGAGLKKPFDPT